MTEIAAKERIYGNAFSHSQAGRIGAGLEWPAIRSGSPDIRVGLAELQAILTIDVDSLPAKVYISVEPGGRLDLRFGLRRDCGAGGSRGSSRARSACSSC
jgi:hypothetical protein